MFEMRALIAQCPRDEAFYRRVQPVSVINLDGVCESQIDTWSVLTN